MPITIEMPKLSDTMTEGTLLRWIKKVGDSVAIGDVIAEIETDKATMEMEAFDEGTLAEVYVEEGQKAQVGQKLAKKSQNRRTEPKKPSRIKGSRQLNGPQPRASRPPRSLRTLRRRALPKLQSRSNLPLSSPSPAQKPLRLRAKLLLNSAWNYNKSPDLAPVAASFAAT
jgi:pyruvate/2-oxoglutarate dehydrogenase complex dihydrolipoamide acyltransferase (E2) component